MKVLNMYDADKFINTLDKHRQGELLVTLKVDIPVKLYEEMLQINEVPLSGVVIAALDKFVNGE